MLDAEHAQPEHKFLMCNIAGQDKNRLGCMHNENCKHSILTLKSLKKITLNLRSFNPFKETIESYKSSIITFALSPIA